MNGAARDVSLAEWCTMGVGGAANWFVRATNEMEVLEALQFADTLGLTPLILGGGSNVVIADAGFPGVVVQIAITGIEADESGGEVLFKVGSGEPWDPFVARTVEANCGGLECLSGIPGLVGGTPVQNVGAYGQEVSTTIRTVRAIDRTSGAIVDLTASECAFGYRASRFKHADADRFVVTRVDFALRRGAPPTITYTDVVKYFAQQENDVTLAAVRAAIIDIRSRKGMVIRDGNPANQSCGSFFVNPVIAQGQLAAIGDAPHYPAGNDRVKIPAAWLIERAGFPRGYREGPVGISPFQAQGLINRGGATAADVVGLALAIKRAVLRAYGVALVPEPVFIGFASDDDVRWLLDPAAEP